MFKIHILSLQMTQILWMLFYTEVPVLDRRDIQSELDLQMIKVESALSELLWKGICVLHLLLL